MKQGKTLQELAMEIERQKDVKRDMLVDTRRLQMAPTDGGIHINVNRGVNPEGLHEIDGFGTNEIIHRQIGSALNIPAKYYDKMRDEYPELLAANVNGWFNKEPSNRLLRTLDGRARALLSDRYRVIDNYDVAVRVLPIIQQMHGAQVESCELTESRMYLKVVNPRVEAEVKKGDVVQAGVIITNSETGQGSLSASPFIYRLVCSNGMVAVDHSMRKYHSGRINVAEADYSIIRTETIEKENEALLMRIEDIVQAAVDETKFQVIVKQMQDATEAKMETNLVPQVVELTAKEYGFTQGEHDGILGHLIQGGDLSLYGLANAVTRHAHDVDSYDRSTDLEAAGYKIITMAPAMWRQMNTAK